jgi:hypothetical protein
MFKKILIYILISSLVFIISGCESKGEESMGIPEKGTYSRCVEVEEKTPYNTVDSVEFPYFDENTLFEDANLIFKGKVIDEKEIAIEEYRDGRLINTYYEGVSSFEVEKIYYSDDSSLEIDDVIKVGNASCSHWWVEGTIKMEKNKKYIVLVKKKSDTLTVEFTKYYDYFVVNYWVPIIPVEDGKYYVDEMLTSLTGNAEEEIIREDINFKTKVYVKGAGFEDELEALILEKKRES